MAGAPNKLHLILITLTFYNFCIRSSPLIILISVALSKFGHNRLVHLFITVQWRQGSKKIHFGELWVARTEKKCVV